LCFSGFRRPLGLSTKVARESRDEKAREVVLNPVTRAAPTMIREL
jgi:hypothetical protein